MANIRVDVNYTIMDGSQIVFRSPADCSAITGLVVYYVAEDGETTPKEFVLSDAHGHNVGDIDHLFAENAVVKVILDVTHGMAFVQNADTNAYIERTFVKTVNGVGPDENGNVEVEVDSDVCRVSYNLVNAVSDNYATTVNKGDDFEFILTAIDGCAFTSLKVIHNGETEADETYSRPSTECGWGIYGGVSKDSGVQGDIVVIAVAELVNGAGGGEDGFSPIAKVTQTASGATISITDKSGTTTATISNGKDGQDGQDGYTPQKGVDYTDGKNGKDGSNGSDGVSPIVSVYAITGGHRITITDKNGTKTVDVMDGEDGQNGAKGNGIKSAVLNADYTLKLTFDDGTSYTTPSIRGATGAAGTNGVDGKDGTSATHSWNGTVLTVTSASGTSSADLKGDKGDSITGDPGTRGTGILKVSTTPSSYTTSTGGQTPTKRMKLDTIKSEASVSEVLPGDIISHSYYLYPIYYVDSTYAYTKSGTSIRGASGSAGSAGKDGADGKDGEDGYTPQKGVDYWTDADQEAIVQQVITALGTPVFGRVDTGNNIVLSGALADGTYTIKYEDADGNVTEVGTLNHTHVPEPTYTNVLPLAINSDKTPFVGANGERGYKTNTRLGSAGTESTQSGMEATGFISVKYGDILRFKDLTITKGSANASYCYFHLYDSSFTRLTGGYARLDQIADTAYTNGLIKVDANNNFVSFEIGYYTFPSLTAKDSVVYVRMSADEISSASVITINEEIR